MSNPATRLQEIQEKMLELLEEAKQIVRFSGSTHDWERAKAYWYGQIKCALTKNSEFLGSSMCTMDDTIASLDTGDEDEEFDDEDQDDEDDSSSDQ